MEDPLLRALDESPQSPQSPIEPAPEMIDQQTAHPQPVHDLLEQIKAQAIAACATPFFDGESASESEPTIKIGVTEAGTVHISAQRNDPAYRAEITLYVRSDLESETEGRYQISGRCEIVRTTAHTLTLHREFSIATTVADDGSVTIDIGRLRSEMAQAIRAFGAQPADD